MQYHLLIADDEKIYRSSLANVLTKSFPQLCVFEAKNGLEVLDILENHPIDCMLLDIRMPKMDGMEVIRHLSEEKQADIPVVLVSGYSDFEYTKVAIQKNVFDYLLKPITPNEAIAVVEKLLKEVERRQSERAHYQMLLETIELAKPQIRLQFFQNIISGRFDDDQLCEQGEFLSIHLQAKGYQCAAVEVQSDAGAERHAFEESQFKNLQLDDLIADCIPSDFTFISFQVQSDLFVLLFCFSERLSGTDERLTALLDHIAERAGEDLGIRLVSGIGQMKEQIQEIGKSYSEACSTLHYQTRLHGPSHAYAVTDFESRKSYHSLVNYDSVCMMIKTRNLPALLDTIQAIETATMEQGMEPVSVLVLYNKFITAIFQTLDEFDIDFSSFLFSAQQANFFPLRPKSLSKIQSWLEDLVHFSVQQMEMHDTQTNSRLVASIKQYFDANYAQPINNTSLAETLGYTSNYLGQIFKSETGISLGEYLRFVRIESAKYLLTNTLKKINDIAEQVGFSNNQYFGNVFKREVGMTPKEYRDLQPKSS